MVDDAAVDRFLPHAEPGPVRRVHERVVGQGQQLVVQRVEQVPSQALRTSAHRGEQIGSPDVADEQRVAGEHGVGLGAGVLGHDDRDGLGGVPRCVPDLQGDLAEGEHLAMRERFDREVGDRDVAIGDGRSGGLRELEVPRQEVGVEMGLDDPFDGEPLRLGIGEVLADVALRVDHHRPTRRGVTDQVAEDGKAREVVLAKEHRLLTWSEGAFRSRIQIPPGVTNAASNGHPGRDRSAGTTSCPSRRSSQRSGGERGHPVVEGPGLATKSQDLLGPGRGRGDMADVAEAPAADHLRPGGIRPVGGEGPGQVPDGVGHPRGDVEGADDLRVGAGGGTLARATS